MGSLGVRDFPRYFEALWGTESRRVQAFPWQRRLMQTVVDEEKGWPEVLDLPTGSGKTAVLDIAIFHLALEAVRPQGQRRAPRRIVMVVDRRTVVDQAHERARRIAQKLKCARKGILVEVASALRTLVGRGNGTASDPLAFAVLRGGMYRDPSWARTPDQPLVVASTVDQVGSRLLFRGYGVSESMRPVHAGLLANDTLLFLDEVHVSRPFDETLTALERYRGWAESPVTAPWRVVRLSATPGVYEEEEARVVFSLDDDDRRAPALARRLGARKPTTVRPVSAKGHEEDKRQQFASACGREALALRDAGARTVAVIVNRVDTARRVYQWLKTPQEDGDQRVEGDVYLLTGRMRPFDRDEIVSLIQGRVAVDSSRTREDRPLVLVATQSIEAGADFDFEALVSECASLDALRQRFGRLDRLGEHGRARAVILGRKDQVEGQDDDPVYGAALRLTWSWLQQKEEWDFGIDHLKLPKDPQLLSARGETDDRMGHAPVLLPAHLDAWAQTSPTPAAEPGVSLWLHGLAGRPADVQVVWRADISEEDLQSSATDRIKDLLAVCPPASAEALPVPFVAARNWLLTAWEPDIADVEAELSADEREPREQRARRAIRWRGDDSEVIDARRLRPGDTIVVPAGYGGLGEHLNWDPAAKNAPVDLGDIVQLQQRGRGVLRLDREVLKGLGLPEPPTVPDDAAPREERQFLSEWLEALQQPDLPHRPNLRDAVAQTLDTLRSKAATGWRLVTSGDDVDRRRILVSRRLRAGGDDVSTEPEISSFTAAPVSLEAHCRGVETWAREFARHCGLSEALIEDLALAAWLHDVGKADPRFQALLWGGDAVGVATGRALIAKSVTHHRDRASRERSLLLSRYPLGTRHEMLSVALVEGVPDIRKRAGDWDLVLHLIAGHHGFARPFAPPVEDPEGLEVSLLHGSTRLTATARHGLTRLDSAVADRFWRLVRRYGWFGLAWLEAILRLADHRRSEQEAREEVNA